MKSIREWLMENDDVAMKSVRDMMGGNIIRVDPRLKVMLKPKLEAIIKDSEGENPKTLLRSIIAVSALIIGELNGMQFSTRKLMDLMNSENDSEDSTEEGM
jgi:hypothetical protein